MVIQTISRPIAGLPITLLELNALAHVLCAVVMYRVWWKKPQNVNDPYKFRLEPSIAALLTSSRLLMDFRYNDGAGHSGNTPQEISVVAQKPIRVLHYSSLHSDLRRWNALRTGENVKYRVIERDDRVWGSEKPCCHYPGFLETATKSNGVVMLLPGDGLEGLKILFDPQKSRFSPKHLTEREFEILELLSNLSTEKYTRLFDNNSRNLFIS